MDQALGIDPDNLAWLATEDALIELDREIVKRGGLRAFIELAWHIIEPVSVFSPNWHIDEICGELEGVRRGESRRLAMAVPPRHMKSTILGVMFPAYVWIHNPSCRMLFISYDWDLALRDSKRTRDLVQSEWFQARWGDKVQLKADNVIILETNKTGIRQCLSIGGRVMGKGADIIVLDDPHDAKDVGSEAKIKEVLAFWKERLPSRLNDPKTGAFIVCHQRVGENDIIGNILKTKRQEYRYLCLPARFDMKHPNIWPNDPRKVDGELLWPAHIPAEAVDGLEVDLGAYAFAAQYQQRPGPREGGLFKRHWFTVKKLHEIPADLEECRGWDIAATIKQLIKSDPDWSACVKIGHSRSTGKFYITDVQRWRVEGGELDKIILSLSKDDTGKVRIRFPQDPGAAGKTRAQQIGTMLSEFSFICEPVTGDKAVNAAPVASQAMIGNVYLVEAPWNDMFLDELTSFPTAAHDDMVDAMSQAFKGFIKSSTGILDYYTMLLEQKKQQDGANLGRPLDGVKEETTTDMAVGLDARRL